jgi:hypothetical protein
MLDATVWAAADVKKIRNDMIDTLIKAVMEAGLQAKAAVVCAYCRTTCPVGSVQI